MITNVTLKTCLNQKIMKISNFIQAVKCSVCPKAKVIRSPNFSESRIFPNIYRMYRSLPNVPKCGLNTRHDNLVRIFAECTEVWIEHTTWQSWSDTWRKLCALTNAPPVRSTQTGQRLSTLFHANCSAAKVYVLYPRQFIFARSCRRRSFLQVLQSTDR